MSHLETPDVAEQTQQRISAFYEEVSLAQERALILDYDGTLAPFSADRLQATPYPGIPALLDNIRKTTNSRVVLVSGRRAAEVAMLLDLGEIEVWGCHGLSRLHGDGHYELKDIDQETARRISEANELLREEGLSDFLEIKPAATAIHWRGREGSAQQVARKARRVWSMLSSREGLELSNFDGGMEIRVSGISKGGAVRTILAEMGRHPAIAYLGDDQTDEDAFAALRGRGLSILVGKKARPTLADVWIQPPAGVAAFLEGWSAACGGAS